jgi:hypothetical protein
MSSTSASDAKAPLKPAEAGYSSLAPGGISAFLMGANSLRGANASLIVMTVRLMGGAVVQLRREP